MVNCAASLGTRGGRFLALTDATASRPVEYRGGGNIGRKPAPGQGKQLKDDLKMKKNRLSKNQAELLFEIVSIAAPITNRRWSGWRGRGQALRGLVARGLVEARGRSERYWRPTWAQATDAGISASCARIHG